MWAVQVQRLEGSQAGSLDELLKAADEIISAAEIWQPDDQS
jgi:hypothetical protein